MQQGPSGTKVPTFGMCRTITSLSQRNRTTKRAWGVGGERGGGGGGEGGGVGTLCQLWLSLVAINLMKVKI